jgi:multidrug resistance efflux pump
MAREDGEGAAVKAVRHELDEVEALTEYSERGAREICEAVVRVVLEAIHGPGDLDETPGDWHRVANDFQRAMFDERARADRIAANLRTAEHAEQELKDVKHAYEREVELADRRAAELDALIAAANAAIASNSLGNIQAWLDACGRASR